jgi:hypothetical protein
MAQTSRRSTYGLRLVSVTVANAIGVSMNSRSASDMTEGYNLLDCEWPAGTWPLAAVGRGVISEENLGPRRRRLNGVSRQGLQGNVTEEQTICNV